MNAPTKNDIWNPASRTSYGVFETMRTYEDRVHKIDQHLARLERSAEAIGMELTETIETIHQMVLAQLEQFEGKYPVRIKVVATHEDVHFRLTHFEIDPAIYEGVSATCLDAERDQPEAKALPYYKSYEAHEAATQAGHYEAILVDREGLVKEGAYSNIFWVKDGVVYTSDTNVLKGVTRQTVIELAHVRFAEITPDELKQADEVFLTKTTTGPVPITSIDGVRIGDGQPGLIARKLHTDFLEFERVTHKINDGME